MFLNKYLNYLKSLKLKQYHENLKNLIIIITKIKIIKNISKYF